jgi:hypothetical protein
VSSLETSVYPRRGDGKGNSSSAAVKRILTCALESSCTGGET